MEIPDSVDSEKQVFNIYTNPYSEKSENIVFEELCKSIFREFWKSSVQEIYKSRFREFSWSRFIAVYVTLSSYLYL